MHSLFEDNEDFNEDISRWNVSSVVDMEGMLCGATSFNGDLSCWEVGQVKAMDYVCSMALPRLTATSRAGMSGRSRTWRVYVR